MRPAGASNPQSLQLGPSKDGALGAGTAQQYDAGVSAAAPSLPVASVANAVAPSDQAAVQALSLIHI